ncbi:cation:dicarboxylase symporter family transporter [Pseudomonas asiatica]|uniref:cation:dicarboxylate symporter family transporter n=1 Tax=Pseudomonas asiatica TaxID=2219225 RepID=UPI002DB701B1|nr:cation:dicarboxylase symporter family transporter [Pseudomonas asiatica]MEB6592640.1 cation:dicarboxylase symporter family transporter [Pseudomonas asiatica]
MIAAIARKGSMQMVLAIACGLLLGLWQPDLARAMKPLSDVFLLAVGALIPFVMFALVVSALGRLGRGVGTVAMQMLAYFLCMSLLSLVVGLAIGLLMRPGVSADLALAPLEWSGAGPALLDALPAILVQACTQSIMLPTLLAAIVTGSLLRLLGEGAKAWLAPLDRLLALLLRVLRGVVRLAPVAAFGAMAFTVSRYGSASLWPLLKFLLAMYVASSCFVFGILALVARCCGYSLLRLIAWLKNELLLVVFTGSSVAALPALVERLERAGCPAALVRLSLTSGYSFNLPGSNIYLAVATLFLAQLAGIELQVGHVLSILLIGLVTTLGSTSVAGSAFLTLAATLTILPFVPVQSAGLLLAVERLMKCRSLTNVLGNCVACLALARWQGTLDRRELRAALGT